jgi:hypothetical protein
LKALSVVLDFDPDPARLVVDAHPDGAGAAVFDDIRQGLLNDAVDRHFKRRR